MKKTLSLVIVLGILASLIPAGNVFAKEEYLFFDSFEAGMANWDFSGGGNRDNSKIVLGKASDGKMALCVNDDLTNNTVGVKSKAINVKPGSTYFIEADFYHEDGKTLQLQVSVVGAGGKVLSSKTATTANLKKWETASAVIETADEATGIIISLATITKTDVGVSYVDKIKVVEGKVNSSGVIENAGNYGPKVGDIMFSESFEDGIGSFKHSDPRETNCYELSDKMASDGKNSLYFHDDRDDLMVGVSCPQVPINEMRKYKLSVDMYAIESRVQIQLRLLDTNGTEMYRSTQYSETGTKRWVTCTAEVSAYPGAAYLKMVFVGELANKPKAYIDNIKITDIGSLGTIDTASAKLKKDLNYRLSVANPGDVIEIEDGVYEHIDLVIPVSGTEEKPITLKAKNPGKVIFKGLSGLEVTGSYIVVRDLIWENSIMVPDILNFAKTSSYCHLMDCAIIDSYPENFAAKQRWVGFGGNYHKISGCYFRGKGSEGLMLELGISSGINDPGHYLVENCYFGDFKYGSINGLEVIRTGLSTSWNVYGKSTIRNCFFEKCNSESEIVSIKCSGNEVYNNTFYNSNGALWARHGDDNVFTGNLFIGGKEGERTAGIEIIGERHIVKDNYFYNLPLGTSAIVINDGNGSPNWVGFQTPVKDVSITNNTIINCDTSIKVGEYSPSSNEKVNIDVPPSAKVTDNAIISYKGISHTFLKGSPEITGMEYANNIVHGKPIGYEGGIQSGVTEGKIEYKVEDGYVIPADGFGANIEEIKKAPKNPFDIIPDWMKKEFYDSGKYTFETVENDPFNSDFDVNRMIPRNDGKIKVSINGVNKEFDVEPQLINSRTMVPMRAIFEEFEAEVNWDEQTASATATTEFTTVKITENSDLAYVNGAEVKLDSPAVIINGRFLVPLRFVSESFGATVEWYDDVTTARITYIAPIKNIYKEEFKPQAPIENALTIYEAIQSGNDDTQRTIRNIFNGGFTDKWAFKPLADGTLGYAILDLGSVKTIDKLMISFGSGNQRIYTFDIYLSNDGVNYTLAKEGLKNSGITTALETFEMGGVSGRYVKYVGHGSNVNTWNNLIEFFVIEKK